MAHVNEEGRLVGSVVEALRWLGSADVLHSFTLAATAFADAGDLDPADESVMWEALGVRVAIAERWSRGGCSALEKRLADAVDRAIAPFGEALHMCADYDHVSDWLGDLWVAGVGIDTGAWWGTALMPAVSIEQALLGIRAEPVEAPRHERAWEDPPKGCHVHPWPYHKEWHPVPCWEVARSRYEEDNDLMAEMAESRE